VRNVNLRKMILAALMAALISVAAQLSFPLPFSPVPLTLQVLVVLLAGGLLGPTWGAAAMLLYLLLGAVAIEALLGLVQYYLLVPGNWIGYDTRTNRPYGIFQQPNVMASFMATGLALAIWLQMRGHANPWLSPKSQRLDLTAAECADLVTFLHALTGEVAPEVSRPPPLRR